MIEPHSSGGTLGTLAVSGVAAVVRLCWEHEKGEPIKFAKIMATVISGPLVAYTCTDMVVKVAGIDSGWRLAVAAVLGALAIGFVYQILNLHIQLPFLDKVLARFGMVVTNKEDDKHGNQNCG